MRLGSRVTAYPSNLEVLALACWTEGEPEFCTLPRVWSMKCISYGKTSSYLEFSMSFTPILLLSTSFACFRMGEEGQPSGGEERMLSEAELLNSSDIDAAFREFLGEMRGVDRDNEVERILRAFKLNPYEQLGVRFDATDDDIKKTYRKKSLMVHPDKCKHPNAKEAFEILGIANKFLTGEIRFPRCCVVIPLSVAYVGRCIAPTAARWLHQ